MTWQCRTEAVAMENEAPLCSTSSADSRRSALITQLSPSDVLFGRGPGPNEFVGNRQFRSIVEGRKERYTAAPKHKAKKKIAKEVYDRVHSLGGRFLKELDTGSLVSDDMEIVWIEVEQPIALEKCKQALRQQKRETSGSRAKVLLSSAVCLSDIPSRSSTIMSDDNAMAPADREGALRGEPASLPMLPFNLSHVLPQMLMGGSESYDIGARLFTFQQQRMKPRTDADAHPPAVGIPQELRPKDTSYSLRMGADVANAPYSTNSDPYSPLMDRTLWQNDSNVSVGGRESRDFGGGQLLSRMSISTEEEASQNDTTKNDLSESLLSFLEGSDHPRFTQEHEALERATMTDEERAAALSDLFGKQCALDAHQNKRARRDLDQDAIVFLVNQMRLEINRIPLDRKRALVEAQLKCHASEFSDARLERFLRCEGMNVKLGALRFVKYWESRRELFGPEKYLLCMTLSGALCDDLVALEVGLCCLLPRLDSSGRQLLLWHPCCDARRGYTSESMLRSLWYVMEVASQENTDVRSGVVYIIWDRDSTIWDFDYKLQSRLTYLDRSCWPVKLVAAHPCCSPGFVIRMTKPIIYALMDKQTRSRTMIHDVPDSQILQDLFTYGIMNDMLPTVMGGTIQLNQSEWISKRRALEIDEI